MTAKTRKATAAEVRAYYRAQGYEVRISRDEGHVTYREPGGMWLEGRWVSEYVVDPETGVSLT